MNLKKSVITACHVCSGHKADDVRVFHRECRTLAEHGYDVTLIAVAPRSLKEGDGITILPLTPPRGTLTDKLIRRERVARLAARLDADLYHVHEPELLAPLLRRVGGKPVIYDVHESYLDVLGERGWIPAPMRKLFIRLWNRSERKSVPRCAAVTAVTEPIARRYRDLNDRVEIIANFPPLSDLLGVKDSGKRDGLVYVGAIRRDRGIFQILEALAILDKRGMELTLRIAGPPVPPGILDEIDRRAESLGIKSRVHYLGVIDRKEVMPLQATAKIGVVVYQPVRNSVVGLPNKLVEFMGVGIPVIFSDFPVYWQVAGESGAGIGVNPEDPVQIADALKTLLRDDTLYRTMGDAGMRAVRERFHWERDAEKLLALYKSVVKEI